MSSSERIDAAKLHSDSLVVDAHTDTAVAVAEWRMRGETKVLERKFLPIMQEGGTTARVTAIGGDSPFFATWPTRGIWPPRNPLRRSILTLDAILTDIGESSDKILLATKASDILNSKKQGKAAVILDLEGCRALGHDLSTLRLFYRMGVRLVQPTHNYRNYFADGCNVRNPSGLTDLGVELVKECNRLGIIVDISHLAEKGVSDVLETSKAPIMNSHTCCKSIVNHPRNMTDGNMKAVAEKGGMIGITTISSYMAKANLEGFMETLDHMIEVCGIDHVGIGTDVTEHLLKDISNGIWGSSPSPPSAHPEELDHGKKMPNITHALVKQGYSEKEIRKVLGENFVKLFAKICGE